MSRADDRIAVPTNGHAPPLGTSGTTTPTAPPGQPTPAPTLAVTPGQLAVGFGILVSLVLLALGRRRSRRG